VKTALTLLVLAFLLNACNLSGIRYIGRTGEISARHALTDEINIWAIKGRISIITPEDAWNGSLNWHQVTDSFEIKIIGPLGQGSLHVTGDKNLVTLKTSDKKKKPVTAPDAESLLTKEMGWELPVSQLRYWVKGVPNPFNTFTKVVFDKNGRPMSFEQSGWSVQFFGYKVFKGYDLPRKIFMQKNEFKVKMIIKNWDLEI